MAKSIRNAFIRVSRTNNTENGLVIYEYDDIKNILLDWTKSKRFKYYAMAHNDEPGDPNPHYHIVLKFNDPTPFEQIKSKFPYGDIENARSVKNCVQYLVHMNDLSKTQYDFSLVFTNDDNIDKFKLQSTANQLLKLDDFIHRIDSGQIREFNLTDYVPIEIFSKYKTQILNALEFYRRKVMTSADRNIDVIIFTGDTGTYKTTYAKQYCKNLGKSFCISSSSNDPMQDYKGEDVLILDDIRDTTFKFHDFLKVLDNHTNSSIVSRYNNKAFIGDTIIITSSQKLSQWYYDEAKEDKEQLYRRISTQMQFTSDEISAYEYDERKHKYVFRGSIPNVNNFTPTKAKTFVLETFKAMGVVLSPDIEKRIQDRIFEVDHVGDFEQLSFSDDTPFFSKHDDKNVDKLDDKNVDKGGDSDV